MAIYNGDDYYESERELGDSTTLTMLEIFNGTFREILKKKKKKKRKNFAV